jgi:hypothetical protein
MSSLRPKTGMVRSWTVGALCAPVMAGVLGATLLSGAALGGVVDHGVYKVERTVLPYWQVGDVDKALSNLCSLGQFNQRVPFRLAAHFYGPYGSALLGAAKGTGLNLWDPFKKAAKDRDYWFYRDRTSACIVMSAQVKNPDPNAAAQQAAAIR